MKLLVGLWSANEMMPETYASLLNNNRELLGRFYDNDKRYVIDRYLYENY